LFPGITVRRGLTSAKGAQRKRRKLNGWLKKCAGFTIQMRGD
jgi:hypothetical protein